MSRRAQVTLTDEQYARLQEEARRTGLSLAELVRRGIDKSYGESTGGDLTEALRKSFGAWKDRDFGGAEYVDGLHRGMAQRLDRHSRSRTSGP